MAGRNLRLRIYSASVLAPATILAVLAGDPIYPAAVVGVAALLSLEWDRLCRRADDAGTGGGGVLAVSVALMVLLAWGHSVQAGLVACLAGAAATAGAARLDGQDVVFWRCLGTFYIGLPAVAMIGLHGAAGGGADTTLWLFGTVWATDIGGYVAGRVIGGPRLAPSISPAKTWSGALGGLGLAVAVGVGLMFALDGQPGAASAGAALLIGLAAEAGDLLESAIKRHFGLKDSGDAIPGHGGLFDRLDSLLLAAPVLWVLVVMTGESPLGWR
ncbi:MAG: phosphatidate cytidylyltransferase [Alphaproteobacteria bacterium]